MGESLILNPFEADIDMSKYGEIRHVEIDSRMFYSIGERIRNLCKMESYTPKWAHIVTWYESRAHKYPFQLSYESSLRFKNTFQLLMVTDGSDSFAFYNYVRMEWPNHIITSDFEVGYKLISEFSPIYQLAFMKNQLNNLVNKSNLFLIKFRNKKCLHWN